MPNLARLWLRASVVYFAFACTFGLVIGIAKHLELASVHAHLNLLGWVSMSLIGLLHATVPALKTSGSKALFIAYQVVFPAFALCMFGTLLGNPIAEIGIRITGTLMLLVVLWTSATLFVAFGKRD